MSQLQIKKLHALVFSDRQLYIWATTDIDLRRKWIENSVYSKIRQTYLKVLLCMCEYVYLPFSNSFLISALSQIELRKEMQKRVM